MRRKASTDERHPKSKTEHPGDGKGSVPEASQDSTDKIRVLLTEGRPHSYQFLGSQRMFLRGPACQVH